MKDILQVIVIVLLIILICSLWKNMNSNDILINRLDSGTDVRYWVNNEYVGKVVSPHAIYVPRGQE